MAINYQLFKIELDSIPTFNGDASAINLFVNACDQICTKYAANVEIKTVVFNTILGKLKDRAKTLICSRNELNTWEKVKTAIYSYFADKRDFGQLVQEFNNTKILQKEDPITFGYRMQDLLSKLMTKLTQTPDIEHKVQRAEIYAQTALEVYLLNLPEDIQVHVKPLRPEDLEEAIGLAQDAINFKTRSNTTKGLRVAPQQIPQKSFTPFKPTNYQNYQQYTPLPNYQPPQKFYPSIRVPSQQLGSFPRGPIPNFPRPTYNHQTNFPTNRQVFGPPRNVWLPGQNKTSAQTSRPTPMSGISTAVAKPIKDVFNNELQPNQENYDVPPIFNEENGLWYAPIDTKPYYPEDDQDTTPQEALQEYGENPEDDENFIITASQENLHK